MANTLENLVPTNKIPPSSEKEDENNIHDQYAEDDEEEETILVTSYYSLCGDCLRGLIPSRWCTGKRRRISDNAGSCRHLLPQEEEEEDEEDQVAAVRADDQVSWLVKSVKKVKEVSELLAGPKWKNFIRRFGRSCNGIISNKKRRVQFHYDPQSYALNFDDAIDREVDHVTYLEFSGRYADTLGMNKG